MLRLCLATLFAASLALPLRAELSGPIRDKGAFLSLIDGRALEIGLYRLSLKVTKDGQIRGSALGWDITGNWRWQDGLFCREMDWSGKAIPFNCQLVEVVGPGRLRFTADKGQGQAAVFRLR